ncbi:MAG TPA: amidohydrolase [Candidatus Limnocylindria bacterium]|nr:amidohydrolase [Candidatus Limnocylindria bacterium]
MDDRLARDLVALSRDIHGNPELAYEERHAVGAITRLLEDRGHAVERRLAGVETAFRARVGPPGPSVALLAEYDALPEIGHACGHNLIAITNVGAFLVAAAEASRLQVGIELIGTPAEEKGGGKLDLLDAGVFGGTVAALSSHPSSDPLWELGTTSLGVVAQRVRYSGVAAHAAVSPEKGKNALNAVIRLFVGVDGWRQHLPDDARVHGIVTDGGGPAYNVVPAHAEAVFGLRAKDADVLRDMVRTFADIARGAALQTGTTVEVIDDMRLYEPTKPHPLVTELLAAELEARGKAVSTGGLVSASTDFGNVSQAVPADYVSFPVSERKIPGHSHEMRDASVTDLAHANALVTVEVLAAAAVRLATDHGLRERLRSAPPN